MPEIAPEHIHPLLVHFPVALWPIATILFAISFIPKLSGFRSTAVMLGLLGSTLGYFALEFGEQAAEIVGPTLCNQTLLLDHGEQSHTAWVILTTIWVLGLIYDVVLRKAFKFHQLPVWPSVFLFLGCLLGGVFLVSSAHKGFQLTYFESAAVRSVQKPCP